MAFVPSWNGSKKFKSRLIMYEARSMSRDKRDKREGVNKNIHFDYQTFGRKPLEGHIWQMVYDKESSFVEYCRNG